MKVIRNPSRFFVKGVEDGLAGQYRINDVGCLTITDLREYAAGHKAAVDGTVHENFRKQVWFDGKALYLEGVKMAVY